MAKVNLLPHRAEARAKRQRLFYQMLVASAVVGVFLGGAVWLGYSWQIDGQNKRNAYLTAETAKLDAQIKEIEDLDKEKSTLLRRKKVIEDLQANRSQMVHLFDELVRTIPEGIRLTSVKQDGTKLTLEGLSQSNARVSAYMRNIEADGWMTNPDLTVIEVRGDDKTLPYAFNLSLILKKPGQQIGPDGQPLPDQPDSSSPASPSTAASSKGGATP
jgi:type IV pilus assembly protein PilN